MTPQIMFYRDWKPLLLTLDDDAIGRIIRAVYQHVDGIEEPPTEQHELSTYLYIASKIDEGIAAYEEEIRKKSAGGRKAAERRAEQKPTDSKIVEDSSSELKSVEDSSSDRNIVQLPKTKTMTKTITKDIRDDGKSKTEPLAEGVAAIPLRNNKEYRLSQREFDEFCAAFPKVDVKAEILRMRLWSEKNPSKQKTQKGVGRFINNWLSDEQRKRESAPPGGGSMQYKPNQFTSFEQRDYSQEEIDELERRLLSQ